MPYENFPYADLHNLNLDWLLKQVKEDHDLLSGTDFEDMVADAVQDAIDDGRIADLINQTILGNIQTRLTALQNRIYNVEDNVYPKIATGTLAMLGCPAASTLDSTRGYSLCMVLHGEKWCIVYDMGNDNAATLINYLRANGISRIDAFVISHYHSDHYQQAAINAIHNADIDVDEWFLPHGSVDWSSFTGTTYSSQQNGAKIIIGLNGETWEEPDYDGYTYEIPKHHPEDPDEKITIEFFNVTGALYNDYYSYMRDEDNDPIASTNYNNFSMCCRVYVGDTVVALTGDIELPAQEKMAKMIKGADVLQIPHHGLDLIDSETFRSSMTGDLFLTAAYGLARVQRLQVVGNLMLCHARELGASVSNVDGSTVLCKIGNGCYLVPTACGLPTPKGTFGDNIPSGADLDDYDQIGFIGFIKNATAASGISNKPTGETGAGRVFVTASNQNSNGGSTGAVMQWYVTSFSYGDPHVYVRWKYEGTWEPWQDYEADLAT